MQWLLVNTQIQSHALLCRGFCTSVPFICTCSKPISRSGYTFRVGICVGERDNNKEGKASCNPLLMYMFPLNDAVASLLTSMLFPDRCF